MCRCSAPVPRTKPLNKKLTVGSKSVKSNILRISSICLACASQTALSKYYWLQNVYDNFTFSNSFEFCLYLSESRSPLNTMFLDDVLVHLIYKYTSNSLPY